MKVPLGGGTPTTLASGQFDPVGIAVDATSVYWVNSGSNTGSADGTVMKVPLGGGTPTPHRLGTDQSAGHRGRRDERLLDH